MPSLRNNKPNFVRMRSRPERSVWANPKKAALLDIQVPVQVARRMAVTKPRAHVTREQEITYGLITG
jgi:hypothetical protein